MFTLLLPDLHSQNINTLKHSYFSLFKNAVRMWFFDTRYRNFQAIWLSHQLETLKYLLKESTLSLNLSRSFKYPVSFLFVSIYHLSWNHVFCRC